MVALLPEHTPEVVQHAGEDGPVAQLPRQRDRFLTGGLGLVEIALHHRDPPEVRQPLGKSAAVAGLPEERDRALQDRLSPLVVAEEHRQAPGDELRRPLHVERDTVRRRKSRLEPPPELGRVSPSLPEALEGRRQPQPELDLVVLDRPRERGAEVVEIRIEPPEPARVVGAREPHLRVTGETEEMSGVREAHRLELSQLLQALERELADRLQHEEARLPLDALDRPQQALGDERVEPVQDHVRGLDTDEGALGRVEREPADEDRRARQQGLLGRREQAVAPVDRAAQGPLAVGEIAGAAREQVEPLVKPREQRHGTERA